MTKDLTTRTTEAAAATIRNHPPRVDHRAELVEDVRAAVRRELHRPVLTRIPDDELGGELTPNERQIAAALAALPQDRARAVAREAGGRQSLKTLDLELRMVELGGSP